MEAMIRLRMSAHDAHYGGGLVDGARMLMLFGDVATELLIRRDGDEGLFRAYEESASRNHWFRTSSVEGNRQPNRVRI